jgi:hypothetical protein
MRTMFKTTLALSFVCAMGLGITTTAGASVCVSVGVNPAYEPCDDGDVDCDNMIVVDDPGRLLDAASFRALDISLSKHVVRYRAEYMAFRSLVEQLFDRLWESFQWYPVSYLF